MAHAFQLPTSQKRLVTVLTLKYVQSEVISADRPKIYRGNFFLFCVANPIWSTGKCTRMTRTFLFVQLGGWYLMTAMMMMMMMNQMVQLAIYWWWWSWWRWWCWWWWCYAYLPVRQTCPQGGSWGSSPWWSQYSPWEVASVCNDDDDDLSQRQGDAGPAVNCQVFETDL